MKLYKLTDRDGYTRRGGSNETLWAEGLTVTARAQGTYLCTDQVIHAYTSPLLALLCNPIHANFTEPQLWEAEGEIVAGDGLKVGVKTLTLLRKIDAPQIQPMKRFGLPSIVRWKYTKKKTSSLGPRVG